MENDILFPVLEKILSVGDPGNSVGLIDDQYPLWRY